MVPAFVPYLGIVLVMILVCFCACGWDKRRAANAGRRVPASTLQLPAFFGGWPVEVDLGFRTSGRDL